MQISLSQVLQRNLLCFITGAGGAARTLAGGAGGGVGGGDGEGDGEGDGSGGGVGQSSSISEFWKSKKSPEGKKRPMVRVIHKTRKQAS